MSKGSCTRGPSRDRAKDGMIERPGDFILGALKIMERNGVPVVTRG